MGLAFTIDTPVKVAHYGISSVMSIGEDRLLESVREHYTKVLGRTFVPVSRKQADYRARRITSWLNLVDELVRQNTEAVRKAPFTAGSSITKYFAMLPSSHPMSVLYKKFTTTGDPAEKNEMELMLRRSVVAGSVDVNIMTKTDRDNDDNQGNPVTDGSDAVAALRGYAKSTLEHSSVVFSAGMNPRLFGYLERLPEFYPDQDGNIRKKVIVKVSDYRSAYIQGKYLAKKGIWVSEYRIESGLNCGGHAFATDGYLLGPILSEFSDNRQSLSEQLFELYLPALSAKGLPVPGSAPPIRLTVQGGIGTHEEDRFLRSRYGMDGTGWGTPFLLVPEATTVDAETLALLGKAGERDVHLSHHSPLGIRFHYLKGTSAEKERLHRIASGKPGSPCTEKHLAFNTEFTEKPICTASRQYQELKIKQLRKTLYDTEELKKQIELTVSRECLCVGLSNPVPHKYGVRFVDKLKSVTVCPGPNIVNFNRVVSLREMIDHIYGREPETLPVGRPHMFMKELQLYREYLEELLDDAVSLQKTKYIHSFFTNLEDGMHYYLQLSVGTDDENRKFQTRLREETAHVNRLKTKWNALLASFAPDHVK